MDVGRRKSTGPRNRVVAGSVWESRMKLDEVKGGIKVFNGDHQDSCNNSVGNDDEEAATTTTTNDMSCGAIVPVVQMDKKVNLRPKQSTPVATSGKRKTWKSESLEGSPIQIARRRSEMSKNLDEQCKELSVSTDGIKRSPITKKTRSESIKELSASVVGIEKSPIQTMKSRCVSQKVSGETSDAIEKNSVQLRKFKSESTSKAPNDNGNEKNSELSKAKSESVKVPDDSSDGNAKNSLQLVKAKTLSTKDFEYNGETSKALTNGIGPNSVKLQKAQFEKHKVGDESKKSLKESNEGIDKSIVGIKKARSDENCKVFDVCEEKVITSNVNNLVLVKSPPKTEATDDNHDVCEEKVITSNVNNLVLVKSPPKTEATDDNQDDVNGDEDDWEDEFEGAADEKLEVEIEKKSLVVKEISCEAEQKPKKIVVEEKKLLVSNEKSVPPTPSIVKKQSPPLMSHARVHSSPTKTKPKSIPVSDGFQRIPRTHSKLQSFVDLVMWKDVSKSAFVFGIGTFFIISSSYTKDLNISLISVLAYLGLAYLAAIFLFRSFISRRSTDMDDSSVDYVVGEEEAIWLIKLVLPYVNEFLLKLKALFSGDPATTMKLAVLLFVLARCGSSITIWKMAKLAFFGVFTVPKVCSSYSAQLGAYGTFWIRRFRDAWESCSHKKAVAFVIFTLVWNLSSIVARIWAVFMLFVAFKYYQNSLIRERWVEEEEEARVENTSPQARSGVQVQRPRRSRPIVIETGKQKKVF